MATISSTWSFDSQLPLKACGIDSETIERFVDCDPPPKHSMPFIFTEREYRHAFSLPEPQAGLCAAFCCKEALRKALGEPYNYTDCEIEWHAGSEQHKLILDTNLREQHGILDASAIIRANPLDGDQLIAVVYLFEARTLEENDNDK